MTRWPDRLKTLDVLLARAGRSLVNAIYPLECAGCGSAGKTICDRCAAELPVLKPPFCSICAVPGVGSPCWRCAETPRHFDGIRAPFRHAGVVRRAVHAFKYEGIRAAAPQLGGMMAEYLSRHPIAADLVTPVPMHRSRLRERGYNQAGLLAAEIARVNNLRCDADLLVRVRKVEPQARTPSGAQRAQNVASSVALSAGRDVSGASILLVDDVATTGSTIDVCAAALKQAGARSVWGLVLAVAGGEFGTE